MKLTAEAAAKEYAENKQKLSALEARQQELRPVIERKLEKVEDHTAIMAGWQFCLAETARETFDLKSAKEKLGRKLEPFLGTTSYKTLRVTFKGG